MALNDLIKAARGDQPVDLLLTGCRIIDVFAGEIVDANIAIYNGCIVGAGDYKALETLDLGGRFVAPGFVDAHVHIESSMTAVTEFARSVLPKGTTCVVADPHEIANVLGKAGVEYMLRSAQDQPMNFFFAMPSCVPATTMETAGARLSAKEIEEFIHNKKIVALGEMMNFPGVIFEDPDVLAKIDVALKAGKPIDGHAPGLGGKQLNAYLACGIGSDHECTTFSEAREKLRGGMHIMVREGTAARNLDALLPLINPSTASRMMWCTDDRHPHDLINQGHVDSIIRSAIAKGVDPILAIQMATISPCEYFRFNHLGAIAPGRQADLVVFSNLNCPVIEEVFHKGRKVAAGGKICPDVARPAALACPSSVKIDQTQLDFSIKAQGNRIRVIDVVPDQIITKQLIMPATIIADHAVSDTARDILKLAVIERHGMSGTFAMGFVRGFGLFKGALASSVAHDSHNVIVVGANDADMRLAVEAVAATDGGLTVVSDGNVTARLPLPIAGLMSNQSVAIVRSQMDRLLTEARNIGAKLEDPFMTLGFLALPVIPELKLTDQGLVDVNRFEVVSLFDVSDEL